MQGALQSSALSFCYFSHHTTLADPPPPVLAAFQFAYTTLFGWFATFLFLRTGA